MQCELVPYNIFSDDNSYNYIVAFKNDGSSENVILFEEHLINTTFHMPANMFIDKLKQFGVIVKRFNELYEFFTLDGTNEEETIAFINSHFLINTLGE